MSKKPKLRTVEKSLPPFPLNEFPKDFPFILGKELVYLLASKGKAILEGSEFEAIFATCIGAEWKPSNVGLDDIILGNTAWGAKTVKATNPSTQKKVRLISGRNSPVYSFGETIDTHHEPNAVGQSVLEIWNERVSAVREKFQNLRTVVLVKSNDLTELLSLASKELLQRATVHDNSKLQSPEKELFDEFTPKLKNCTYGSDEYKEFLKGLKTALDHHYANNSHHPEHYPNGINGFDLFDLVEMFFDWKAASERHADGDIFKSIEINKERFGLSEQLAEILKNTATRFYFGV